MTEQEVIETAHRMAWRYKKSSDPAHSDTFTFNQNTLLAFVAVVVAAERDRFNESFDALD